MDTEAQVNIRKVSPEDFSMVGKFIEFHETNQLASPEDIAKKMCKVIDNPDEFKKVLVKVSEM